MSKELVVLLGGNEVGRVRRGLRDRLTFVYDEAWRNTPNAFPLSLSMPLAAKEHGPVSIEAFLWGLLPDNELVLERWAWKFQVSARNVFALIGHVGEDCAGAVQIVPPERLASLQDSSGDGVEWLDEDAVAERLHALREDHAAWRLPRDTGQFSLAGAQPKTALLFEDGKWGIPSGRIPTTHILKPPTGHFDGHAENEHICLALARAAGLPAASSRVMRFRDEIAIVVERYDRHRSSDRIVRVHQEDMCQALAVMPTRKYQNEGGPSVADIVELIRTHSSEHRADLDTFIRAIGFNWLIAGTDAHAKNYSLLIGAGPRIRLAPLYDLASILPYDEFDMRRAKLAMKVGGEYVLNHVSIRQWHKLARELRLDADAMIVSLREMAEEILAQIGEVKERAAKDGLAGGAVDRLIERLTLRIGLCIEDLSRSSTAT
jgi:serine/threonine-protein kinase HipA